MHLSNAAVVMDSALVQPVIHTALSMYGAIPHRFIVSSHSAGKQTSDIKSLASEQYKRTIFAQLERLTIHPSQAATLIAVCISEQAFSHMHNNTNYQKNVLYRVERDFNTAYSSRTAPAYVVLQIGENDEEYRITIMGAEHSATYAKRTNPCFWEKRHANCHQLQQQIKYHNTSRTLLSSRVLTLEPKL